jgi:hypothetical protein
MHAHKYGFHQYVTTASSAPFRCFQTLLTGKKNKQNKKQKNKKQKKANEGRDCRYGLKDRRHSVRQGAFLGAC